MQGYLDVIIKKGGYGKNSTAAAQRLIWEGIRSLVRDNWIPSDLPGGAADEGEKE